MADHTFGGDWTEQKLEILKRYLEAYLNIFNANPKAQYLTTWYVDAFAGTGYRTIKAAEKSDQPVLHEDFADEEDFIAVKNGSAAHALELSPGFDNYLFIEANQKRASELAILAKKFPDSRIHVQPGDANDVLESWCQNANWRNNRAVVFLDPYGASVKWDTIEALAATKAIDFWMLVPVGMVFIRMLPTGGRPNEKWSEKLTQALGTDEWLSAFYVTTTEQTLFGEDESEKRNASFEQVGSYFLERLSTVFERVAPVARVLRNSHNSPMYMLCFAAGNKQGAPTAIRIAKHLLEKF
ncbi:MAG TPA: three-Cys-motif partner protein TcmP [Capsulimonadaceae bacterium]|jgi:three-Cys-motif partner protein